ncbi:MAG: hypothetical protein ACU85E_02825 [Gammaproteobacteria bacterium]
MPTHRKAKVLIENQTGQRILSVSVGHKYSNDYKNTFDWEGPIEIGKTTNAGMVVDYHTGALTTGRDWWVVSWVTEDGKTYVTNPKNLRGIIDFLEGIGSKISAPLASLATALSLAPEPVISKVTGAAVAVTSVVVGGFCNAESTNGFKQHILRKNDQDAPTKIILKQDTVVFHSKSGESITGTTVIT